MGEWKDREKNRKCKLCGSVVGLKRASVSVSVSASVSVFVSLCVIRVSLFGLSQGAIGAEAAAGNSNAAHPVHCFSLWHTLCPLLFFTPNEKQEKKESEYS